MPGRTLTVTGHAGYDMSQYNFGAAPRIVACLLRNPIDHLLSNYFFSRAENAKRGTANAFTMGADPIYNLEAFLDNLELPEIAYHNNFTYMLAPYGMNLGPHPLQASTRRKGRPPPGGALEIYESAAANLKKIDIVGTYERIDEFLARLGEALGCSLKRPEMRFNPSAKDDWFGPWHPAYKSICRKILERKRWDALLYQQAEKSMPGTGCNTPAVISRETQGTGATPGLDSTAEATLVASHDSASCAQDGIVTSDQISVSLVAPRHIHGQTPFHGYQWGPLAVVDEGNKNRWFRTLGAGGAGVLLHHTTVRSGFVIHIRGRVFGDRDPGAVVALINGQPPETRTQVICGNRFTIVIEISHALVTASAGHLVVTITDPSHQPGQSSGTFGFYDYHIHPIHPPVSDDAKSHEESENEHVTQDGVSPGVPQSAHFRQTV